MTIPLNGKHSLVQVGQRTAATAGVAGPHPAWPQPVSTCCGLAMGAGARARGAALLPPPMAPPSFLPLLLFALLSRAACSQAQLQNDRGSWHPGSLHTLAQQPRAAPFSTPQPDARVPICPDFGPSPSAEQGSGHSGHGIRFCWGRSWGEQPQTQGSASRARRRASRQLQAWGRAVRNLEETKGQGQEQQQEGQAPSQDQGQEQGQAHAPGPQQGLVAAEDTGASLVPQVALLESVYVDHKGNVFNATHRFLFGASEGIATEPLESPVASGQKVVELAEVVNLALGLPWNRHQLTEVIHRLPLFLQLCPLMPRLNNARFLLGDHRALRGGLGHLLGFPPWEHTVQPVESGKAIILAKVLYQPIHAPCPRCPALWAALRNTFLLPPDGLPIFNADWTCRVSWPDIVQAAQSPPPPAPLPSDWVVLTAGPPASLPVDPSLGPQNGMDMLFLPHRTLGELVRSSFWEDRVLPFSGDTNKATAQGLFRRAALLVSAPGAALELLPFLPRGAVVVLLEPQFVDPVAPKRPKNGPPPEDDPWLAQHKREAKLLSDTLHAFAEACQLQLLPVACPVAPPAPGGSGVLDGLQCWQDRVAEALAAAEDALCKSGLLGPSPACGVPPGTLPGTALQAEGVVQLGKWAACVGEQGRWMYDPLPRRLPWGVQRVADPGSCDSQGFVNASAADALAALVPLVRRGEPVDGLMGAEAMKALESKWDVRLSLKYRWAVDGTACPAPFPPPSGGEEELVQSEGGSYGQHWQPFSPRGMCAAMAGSAAKKHILFLGDSLTEQMATALAYNMLLDEDKPVEGAAFQKERPQECLDFLEGHGVKDAISCFTVTARACPGLKITFLRNNRLRIVTDSVIKQQVAYYLPFSTVFRHYADDADVIVMNRGAHFTHTARYSLELLATCRLLRERYPQKLILFRNTPPGHANCTDHDRPLESAQDARHLPLKYNWKHFLEQNEVAKGIVAQFGILYLDVYSLTKLRADGHKGVTKTFIDCLHYCNPGVLDYWIELLFNTLRHLRLHSS